MAELLIEIGTEEIPSGYLEEGLQGFSRLLRSCLEENRIKIQEEIRAYGTPRRLVLTAAAVAERQEDLVQEVTGPPKGVAFDGEGNPTKAALGFAQKQGVSVDELGFKETPKGEYVYVNRQVSGRSSGEVLSEHMPRLISEIPWPKSMRWGSTAFAFVRPIHWIVALLDGQVLPFEVAGIRSGNRTWGHRFMAPGPQEVAGLEDYLSKMQAASVLVDPDERERAVRNGVRKAAEAVGGVPADDPGLVKTVSNLVEFPSAVCGGFEAGFLCLPEAVLITVMREHQKYFAVYNGTGNLMPNFIAVNNTLAKDENVVRRGHERVLRARLSDADFFFEEDRKRTLADRLEDLKGVIYQAELGTSYAKVERFSELARYLAERVAPREMDEVVTTARLCKCDLVTQMVDEFPSLQGVMGEVYARLDGYPEAVCTAVRQHYLPERAGGVLPDSTPGAVVGCADRMDTVAGCFALGMEPSGSSDPFAVRRHALSLLRILEAQEWDVSLEEFVNRSLVVLAGAVQFDRDAAYSRMMEFFRERYRQMMLREGYDSELVEAVIAVGFDRVYRVRSRIHQLRRFVTESEEFEALALTFKRIRNILKRQEKVSGTDPELFRENCETELWDRYREVEGQVLRNLKEEQYYRALGLLAELRKPVDEFFEKVEILTDDPLLKKNRLSLLQGLETLFLKVADLSKFSI